MKEITVSVITFENKILLLKRSAKKRYDHGKWEFVSGFVRGGELEDQARRQVIHETGLNPTLVKSGKSYKVKDEYGVWFVHPFLFSSKLEKVKLRPEDHQEYRWINSKDLARFSCVKDLGKNLDRLE